MGNPDRKGYYRILGVDPSASAEAVKKAYRQRSKELHPDHNKRMGADIQFAALNDAYRVLSDPDTRARYDTTGLEREAPGGGETGREVGTPVPCGRCGRVSAQPRYVIFHQVVGRLRDAAVDSVQGIYCARCARDVAMTASLFTWALGWWAWNGPPRTLRAIRNNMRGGQRPAAANHRLLVYQAQAFEQAGKAPLARALAREALEIDPHGDLAALARRIMGPDDDEVPQLKDQWSPDPLAMLGQLMPGIVLLVALLVLVPDWHRPAGPPPGPHAGSMLPGAPPAPRPDSEHAAHITADGVILRVAPGDAQAALATLGRFEDVTRLERLGGGWVRVRAGDLEGYVRPDQLAGGYGSVALAAWCAESLGDRPGNGQVFTRAGQGPHTVKAANHTQADALVKLKDDAGRTVLAFYLWAGAEATVGGVPEGAFQTVFALGRRFSNGCVTFMERHDTLALVDPVDLHTPLGPDTGGALYAMEARLALTPAGAGAVPIDPVAFATD
ncbi:MAG: DnaJ domain-containing protein [Nitrospirae bacterium]|nr:DnaJ domain-containing protein [Nitrospirota bacterium]